IEESSPQQWVISRDAPIVGLDKSSYVVRSPLVDGKTGTYPHLHQGNVEGRHHTPLTYGPYTVYKLLAWDQSNHQVYYIANQESQPAERHLWRVTTLEASTPRLQECLTCFLNDTEVPPCRHFTPYMGDDNFEQVILHCEGPEVPYTMLYSIPDCEVVMYLHNNSDLRELSATMAWPKTNDFSVKIHGFKAQVRLTVPPDHLEEENAYIHPVVIAPGGGPDEQKVNHKWGVSWNTYIASNKSWVVMEVDVRGSGGQELGVTFKPGWHLGDLE
ncbi:unnamed protein product, partial [Meganyctiphanes norvegica]